MTKAELLKKYGISRCLSPEKMNMVLSDCEAKEFERFCANTIDFINEIEENIRLYCTRCRYYNTEESDKCDSWIHGNSYGVDCRYIGIARGEDMSLYQNRKKLDF